MLLSDKRIHEERAKGNIIILPFEECQLGTNSYDVRIGKHYYRAASYMADMHLSSINDVTCFWGVPYVSSEEIPVESGETILAHTVEHIETLNGFTFQMHARSTIGRCGLSVCKCAGLGDSGYSGRLTMEISNHTKARIWIPLRMRVAQVCFMEIGQTLKSYQGKYGEQDYKPEDMLPKPYLDFDFRGK
jgi:dCTP deaminase